MRRSTNAIVCISTVICAGWAAGAMAQPVMTEKQCSDKAVFDLLSKPPNDCKKERIHATGGMRPLEGLAKGSAQKEWRREVLTKYGERFQNIEKAQCRTTECVQAAIAGMTRCSISAIPCAVKPTFEGGGSVAQAGAATAALSPDEIREMQRLLKVNADGDFGGRSITAMRAWQRSHNLPESNTPTRDVLERLRSAAR